MVPSRFLSPDARLHHISSCYLQPSVLWPFQVTLQFSSVPLRYWCDQPGWSWLKFTSKKELQKKGSLLDFVYSNPIWYSIQGSISRHTTRKISLEKLMQEQFNLSKMAQPPLISIMHHSADHLGVLLGPHFDQHRNAPNTPFLCVSLACIFHCCPNFHVQILQHKARLLLRKGQWCAFFATTVWSLQFTVSVMLKGSNGCGSHQVGLKSKDNHRSQSQWMYQASSFRFKGRSN